jgi:integrase
MPRKERSEGTRNPNGASSIYYSEYDSKWHGRVTVGVKDDGSPDRRHIKRATEAEVIAEVRKLERERDDGTVRKQGQRWTMEKWLLHWLETIARPSLKYQAYRAYRGAVYTHLIPGVGRHRLDKVQPEHFEKLYAKIVASGLKPATAHQVHRTARRALNVAVKRGHIGRNPVAIATAPRIEEEEIEPLSPDEVQLVIKAALARRNGVRYVLALSLGTRQGETIGLKWSRLDDETQSLRIRKQLQRRTWEHGCADPHACGKRLHKLRPCPEVCKRHTRPCPPPCGPDCTRHASRCPQRKGGGLVEADVKSLAGRRGIALPGPLYQLLIEHRAAQAAEREHAGTVWEEGGWMFTQPNGRPLDPRRDYDEWQDLLAEAGVREARLHDARHTAATVLMLLGVPERAAMDIMGWSNSGMAKRYQHPSNAMRRDIADRVGGYLWKDN